MTDKKLTKKEVIESLKRQIQGSEQNPYTGEEALRKKEEVIDLVRGSKIVVIKPGARVGTKYAKRASSKYRYLRDPRTGKAIRKLGLNPNWRGKETGETRRAYKVKSKYLYSKGLSPTAATFVKAKQAMDKSAAGKSTRGMSAALKRMLSGFTAEPKQQREPRVRQARFQDRFQRMPRTFEEGMEQRFDGVSGSMPIIPISEFHRPSHDLLEQLRNSEYRHRRLQELKGEGLQVQKAIEEQRSRLDRQAQVLAAENCFSSENPASHTIDLQENIFADSKLNLMERRADSIDILNTKGRPNILQVPQEEQVLKSRFRLRFGRV